MLVALVFSTTLPAQNEAKRTDEPPNPLVSSDALSPDQIAIYKTVLARYSKDFPGRINLADTIDALDASGEDLSSCMRNLEEKGAEEQKPVVHRLPESLVADLPFVLVDRNLQAAEVKRNDPQNLVRRGDATEDQIGKAVDEAFRTGLFTLSEIAFDIDHHHAVVTFSFWCGRLCGHGALLGLNKVGSKWRIAKRCVDWVS
jgi:hypothetical protein